MADVETLIPSLQSNTSSVADAKRSTSARRCLFGRSKRSENQIALAELRDQLSLQAKNRWNMDFQNLTPLPGKYEWIRTDAANAETLDIGLERVGRTNIDRNVGDGQPYVNNGILPREAADTGDDVTDDVDVILSVTSDAEAANREAQEIGTENENREYSYPLEGSYSTPLNQQTTNRVKRRLHSLQRLTWAPKKKTRSLTTRHRRALREATIPDYFPLRKPGNFSARRQLKL